MFGSLSHWTWATTRWRGESYFTYLWTLTLLHGQSGQAKVQGNVKKLKEWEHMDFHKNTLPEIEQNSWENMDVYFLY